MEKGPSLKELRTQLDRLRTAGRNAEADDLEIWIDYRLEQARETVEAQIDVMNEGSNRG